MTSDIAIELVLVEDEKDGYELCVLDWEFDKSNDKAFYFKIFPLKDWLGGRRDPPEYIAYKGDLVLYARDYSGYISTSNRLTFCDDGEKFYDEYGRPYIRSKDGKTLFDCKMQLIRPDTLGQLGEKEVIRRMKEGELLS